MDSNIFKRVSMTGRLAYIIMCAERYATEKYPEKDFSALFYKAWDVTESMFDEWDYRFIEIIPEYLFEFDNYKDSDFEYLSESEYNQFTSLLRDTDDEFNKILLSLHEIVEVYAYTSIPNYGKESVDIVMKVVSILENSRISVPDPQKVAFSSFTEKNGWGELFSGRYLSIVCNNNIKEQ